MTTFKQSNLIRPDTGYRLGDDRAIIDAIINNNSGSASYNITAAGTTQATATALTTTVNEVDNVALGAGVGLPLSTGKINTPYQYCLVINNSSNTLLIYPAANSVDKINGVTSFSQPSNSSVLFASGSPGNWFPISANTGQTLLASQTQIASMLPNWRVGLSGVQNGVANTSIFLIGDSTTIGYGSNATTTSMRFHGYPNTLAAQLNAMGINAEANGFIGDGGLNNTSPSSTLDSRLSVGSGWSETGIQFIGGLSFAASSTTSNLGFTPTVNVDTFVVTYLQYSGLGTFSYKIGAGSTTNVNTNGTSALQTVVVSTTLGANTLNLNWVSGSVYIIGIDAYNSANKQVRIINGGWSGSHTTDWANNVTAFGIANEFAIGQSLSVIQLGINDMGAGYPLATSMTNLQAVVTACKLQGDVILMTPEPESTTIVSAATQSTYAAAVMNLAAANNIVGINLYNRWQSYAISNALGMYYDTTHPSNLGYPDVSRALLNTLLY